MPASAARNCTRPGCAGVVRDGVCSKCGVKRSSNWAHQRDGRSASQRGYGSTWRKLRAMVMAEQPLCVECERHGMVVPAEELDHIVPRHMGGTDDADNLQPLCKSCHKSKTAVDSQASWGLQPSAIPVTVVAGAPGSGKTTWVQSNMVAGDLVLDLDTLYIALSGGLSWYDKPVGLLPFVCEARDAVLARLHRDSTVRHAWIITGDADRRRVRTLCDQLGAELHVMDATVGDSLRHIAQDDRRRDSYESWARLVYEWWRTWRETQTEGGGGSKSL